MTTQGRWERILRDYPGWASFLALATGDLVLVGWRWDSEMLKSVLPGFDAVNPITAFALAISGLSLWLLRDPNRDPRELRFGRVFAALVAGIGALRLIGHWGAWHQGIDTIFFSDKLEIAQGVWRNRMEPITAVTVLLVGTALALIDVKTPRGRRPSEQLSLAVAGLTLFVLVAYAYSSGPVHGFAGHFAMPLPAAAVLLALSSGVVCARREGLAGRLTTDTSAGALLRRLAPAVIGVPIVFGWLLLAGQREGAYDAPTGVALGAIAIAVVLAVLVYGSALSLDRAEAARREAGDDLLGRARDELIARSDVDHFPRAELTRTLGDKP